MRALTHGNPKAMLTHSLQGANERALSYKTILGAHNTKSS